MKIIFDLILIRLSFALKIERFDGKLLLFFHDHCLKTKVNLDSLNKPSYYMKLVYLCSVNGKDQLNVELLNVELSFLRAIYSYRDSKSCSNTYSQLNLIRKIVEKKFKIS